MAITISTCTVSNDLSTIDLEFVLDPGDTASELLFWDEDTYKDPSMSLDLTSSLVGTGNSEILTFSASDLNLSRLTGIYFFQISSTNGDAVIVATFNLTQYYVVQAKLLANIDLSCLSCNVNFQNSLLFDMYLEAVNSSLILGRFQDAIDNLAKLKIVVETSDCDECNNLEPLVSSAGNIVSVGVIDCLLTDV